jgi:translation initiation factor 5
VIKYFGFELGAQTNTNPSDDRWIINGAHEANKLQDYLDGFITKFVLCKKCKNPETIVHIKDERITLDCKACGQISDVDPRLKLSGFIIKNEPKKGKKDKASKKAERRARKGAGGTEQENGSNGGSNDSNSDQAEDNDDLDINGDSDDELTRRINAEAKEIEDVETKEIEWSVDTSEAAVKARAKELPDDLKRALVLNGEEEDGDDGEGNAYDQFGDWIIKTAAEKGGVSKVDDVDVYLKAKELGIETKHRTLTVLAQTIFTENILKEIEPRAAMLKKVCISRSSHWKGLN